MQYCQLEHLWYRTTNKGTCNTINLSTGNTANQSTFNMYIE